MNRTGLTIALSIGFVVGLICAIDPQLDIDIAAIWFNRPAHLFDANAQLWVQHTRQAARIVITLLVLPAFLAIIGKLIWPRRRMLIEARAALFLIATLALGPGLLTNVILKDHWGRPRPIDVQQFGGEYRFVPWWDPRGGCPDNCSFVAGEPSGAFWTLAPAALAGPELAPIAYAAALAFGVGVGILRIAAGAHFFSDVVFAGVFMYLLIWLVHGLIYRWGATRIDEAAAERRLADAGDALAGKVRGLRQRRDKSL
ncbi:MAG: phosphatase PAP2 family protein [Xanthobacteraceae bacterium]